MAEQEEETRNDIIEISNNNEAVVEPITEEIK